MSKPVTVGGLPPFGTASSLTWKPLRPGVDAAWIYGEDSPGPRAALLRYEPGATVPEHEHHGYEHILVLAGAQSDGTSTNPAGTLTVSPPGSHHAITSPDGCIVLAIWTGPLEFKTPE